MKLKYRLVVSFFIIVLLPILLVVLMFFTLGSFGGTSVSRYWSNLSSFSQEGEIIEGYSDEEFEELLEEAREDPEAFLKDFLPGSRQNLVDIGLTITLILAFTAIILILWIYNGVISKVNRLIYGANNIKDGNLDFSIASKGKDELSELLNTFEDMKDRLKRDSEEKLHIENEQRELLSNIAHDIKTPLTAIRGYAQGLIDGVADTEEKRENYLRIIIRKADELDTLLNELAVYSNISTNRIPYNFEQVRVSQYFEDALVDIKSDNSNRNMSIRSDIDVSDEVEMIADPEQLHRVISNIVENAYKYKKEGRLNLDFRVNDEPEGFVQIEIEDNGIGIKPEELPKIFDRMYRGDSSRTDLVGGSGIGLSIAKKIIEDHGGRIWATSKINEGTCFYLLLRKNTVEKQTEEKKDDQNSNNRRRRGHSKS